MSGITGLGTTYNLPNFTGILHQLTPADTPLFSIIGGLTGGGQVTSNEFEWEAYDLRSAAQRTALEGADAPTSSARVRAQVKNIVEIHQEQVSVSYTKLAAYGQKAGVNNAAVNPITNELDWQTQQTLKEMVRDIEYSFVLGRKHVPSDNTTTKQTAGLTDVIATNVLHKGDLVVSAGLAISASADTITATANGLSNGTPVYLNNIVGPQVLNAGVIYYVVNTATNTIKLATTTSGTAIDIDADGTCDVHVLDTNTATKTEINALLQSVYDNGGISETETAAIMVGSTQKIALTASYLPNGVVVTPNRNVGGVNLETIETDFGTLNVVRSRFVPKHAIMVVSMDQLRPVYLETPGKGHFFAEPLAKTGASERVQLYGEVGLEYGAESAHGAYYGFKLTV